MQLFSDEEALSMLNGPEPGISAKKVLKSRSFPPCRYNVPANLNGVTAREAQILVALLTDDRQKQIANELHISVRTVETHKCNAFKKLKLTGTVDLVRFAVSHGWMQL